MNARKGLPLVIIAGVLSAVFSLAINAGVPLGEAAAERGAYEPIANTALFPFSHGGTWVTNVLWCIFLIRRNRSGGQFFKAPEGASHGLWFLYHDAILSGSFWYFQFFFYVIGHHYIGETYGFVSWPIHMSLLILFSNLYGYLFKEWKGANPTPKLTLYAGMAMIVCATFLMGYGVYKGGGTIL